jgi:hypothetical protein
MKTLVASLLMTMLATPLMANPDLSWQNKTLISQTFSQNQNIALLVAFPQPVTVDVGKGDRLSVTTYLTQNIQLPSGDVIPANTPVSVTIQPQGEGAVLTADALVISGQKIPITAKSQLIPSRVVTNLRSEDVAKRKGAAFGNLLSSIAGAAGVNIETQQRIANGGAALGIFTGMNSPENYRIVEISSGYPYVLDVTSLPSYLTQVPQPQAQPTFEPLF